MKQYLSYLDFNELKEEIKTNILLAEERIKALQKITYNTTKDNKPFKQLSKNFNNCFIDKSYFSKYLKVEFYVNSHGYQYETVSIKIDPSQVNDPDNREIAETDFYGRITAYYMNVEEIKQAIQKRIDENKKYIEEQQYLLNNFDDFEAIKYLKLLQQHFDDNINLKNLLYGIQLI